MSFKNDYVHNLWYPEVKNIFNKIPYHQYYRVSDVYCTCFVRINAVHCEINHNVLHLL